MTIWQSVQDARLERERREEDEAWFRFITKKREKGEKQEQERIKGEKQEQERIKGERIKRHYQYVDKIYHKLYILSLGMGMITLIFMIISLF